MRPTLLISAVLLVTLTAGVVGLDWGLPYNWHADEKVNQAAGMIDRGSADPLYFVNPHLHLYLVWGLTRIAYAAHPGAFVPAALGWNMQSTEPDGANRGVTLLAYRLARTLSVGFAVLLVWLLWRVGRASFDAGTGLLAAAFLSVTMGLANVAHFATMETTLFVIVLAALGSFQALAIDPSPRRYIVAGTLAGLACSTKYTVWLLAVPFVAAHLLAHRAPSLALRRSTLFLVAGLAGAAAFAVTTPYSILSWRRFAEDLWLNWLTGAPTGSLVGERHSWGTYVVTLGNALGWPLYVAALAGASALAMRVRRLDAPARAATLVHGAWILSFWGFYGISPHHALRFIMPIVPSLLLLGAAGLIGALRARGVRGRLARGAIVIVLVYSAAYTAEVDRKFLRDPRYAAGEWLKRYVPAGREVGYFATEAYLPYFDRPEYRVRNLGIMNDLTLRGDAFWSVVNSAAPQWPDVLVDSTFYFDRFLDSPDRFSERVAFYRQLLDGRGSLGYRPVARFTVHGPVWLDPMPELVAPDVYVFARASARWR